MHQMNALTMQIKPASPNPDMCEQTHYTATVLVTEELMDKLWGMEFTLPDCIGHGREYNLNIMEDTEEVTWTIVALDQSKLAFMCTMYSLNINVFTQETPTWCGASGYNFVLKAIRDNA